MKKKIRNNKKPVNKLLILRVTAALIVLGIITGIIFLLKSFFTVKTIQCQLLSGESCPQELADSLSSLQGSSMFFEDYSQKLQQSSKINQPVSLVHLKKTLPDTIIVTFQQEAAAYTVQNVESTHIASKTGRIFTHQMDTTGLIPTEITTEYLTADGFIDPTIHQTLLNIIETCAELQLPLTKIIWVDKSTIKLSMENRTEMFVIDSERPSLELHRLSLVLKSGEYRNIEEPKQELDLRFTMPVLRTQS